MVLDVLIRKMRHAGTLLMARRWNPLEPSYFFTFNKVQLIFSPPIVTSTFGIVLVPLVLRGHCLAHNPGSLAHQQ